MRMSITYKPCPAWHIWSISSVAAQVQQTSMGSTHKARMPTTAVYGRNVIISEDAHHCCLCQEWYHRRGCPPLLPMARAVSLTKLKLCNMSSLLLVINIINFPKLGGPGASNGDRHDYGLRVRQECYHKRGCPPLLPMPRAVS